MTGNDEKIATILGCNLNMLNMLEVTYKIESLINTGWHHIITLNAEMAYYARDDNRLRKIINAASLVTPDGIGIVWAAHMLGYDLEERVTGIDLMYSLCDLAAKKGWRVYLIGAAPGTAEQAEKKLADRYPGLQVVGTRNGYFRAEDNEDIIQQIRAAKPHILFAALGAPKQEFWIYDNQKRLEVPVCMGVGGSFDVIAGHKKRAPEIMIKLNMEWLYRLMAEPERLRRQMVLPKFALTILKEKHS